MYITQCSENVIFVVLPSYFISSITCICLSYKEKVIFIFEILKTHEYCKS